MKKTTKKTDKRVGATPSIGRKCFACEFFSHKDHELYGRRKTAFMQIGSCFPTFGHCSVLDCDDVTGIDICKFFKKAIDA